MVWPVSRAIVEWVLKATDPALRGLSILSGQGPARGDSQLPG